MKVTELLEAFLIGLVLVAVVAVIFGFPTMWLWNWLMPELFELQTITFWQALGLNVLCSILFKSSKSTKEK